MTRIVYIAGYSRSGSTLVARALAEYTGFQHVGELTFFWERGLRDAEPCGCGESLQSCSFWAKVLAKLDETDPQIAGAELPALIEARQAVDSLPAMAFRRQPRRELVDRYADRVRDLVEAISLSSSAAAIIDSSKRPSHGLLLAQMQGLSVDVVHVVRDPRAVSYSALRKRPRPEAGASGLMPTNKAWRTATRWVVHNHLAARLRAVAASYQVVRYEDFVTKPGEVMNHVLATLRAPATAPLSGLREGTIRLGTDHSVSGNPMRFTAGPIPLRIDDEWRTAMPDLQKLVVSSIASPLLLRYRYLRR